MMCQWWGVRVCVCLCVGVCLHAWCSLLCMHMNEKLVFVTHTDLSTMGILKVTCHTFILLCSLVAVCPLLCKHVNESCHTHTTHVTHTHTHESIMIHVMIYLYYMTGFFPHVVYFPDDMPVVGRACVRVCVCVCVCVCSFVCLSSCLMSFEFGFGTIGICSWNIQWNKTRCSFKDLCVMSVGIWQNWDLFVKYPVKQDKGFF